MQEISVQKFIDLVSYDQRINKFEQELATIVQHITGQEAKIAGLNAEIQRYKQEMEGKKRDVNAKEAEMKALNDAQKEKQATLDRVTTGKEYQSVTHEIESLKQKQHNFEAELLQVWHLLDGATRVYDTKKKEADATIAQLNEDIEKEKTRIAELEKEIEQLYAGRSQKIESIPTELLEKYEIMRKTVHNPVVPIINNSCSACFYPVNQQDLINVRKKNLIQCKECYRFLYREESHEAAQPL